MNNSVSQKKPIKNMVHQFYFLFYFQFKLEVKVIIIY
jgi:hypothetical protein